MKFVSDKCFVCVCKTNLGFQSDLRLTANYVIVKYKYGPEQSKVWNGHYYHSKEIVGLGHLHYSFIDAN